MEGREDFSTGANVSMIGEPLRDQRDILEHRRARLTELLASGAASAELRAHLQAALADVEERLMWHDATALQRAA